jgi:hypothetical protein
MTFKLRLNKIQALNVSYSALLIDIHGIRTNSPSRCFNSTDI